MLQQQQQQAAIDQTNALQEKLQGDTASLVARYGVLKALSGDTSASLAGLSK